MPKPGTVGSNQNRPCRRGCGMNHTTKNPLAVGAVAGYEQIDYISNHNAMTERPQRKSAFPLCILYDVRIIDTLPMHCPLRSSSPFAALAMMHNAGFQLSTMESCSSALAILERHSRCSVCVSDIYGHPTIRRLRRVSVDSEQHASRSKTSPASSSPTSAAKPRVIVSKRVFKSIRRGGSRG